MKQDSKPKEPHGFVTLDGFAEGQTLHLVVTNQSPDKKELLYIRSNDGGKSWQKAIEIPTTEGKINSKSRGYYAQVAGFKNKVAVIWNVPGNSKFGAGPLATAVSEDFGKTWSKGANPSDDNSVDRHAFLDITSDKSGWLHATWLDSRDGEQGLRFATSNDFGKTWKKNVNIDSRTCQCCWNRIYSFQTNKLLVIYRDINPRDMALAESTNIGETWSRVSSVGAFDWKFDGCPHMGASLAYSSQNKTLFATVWTGKEGVTGPHLLRSSDFGKTWSDPLLIGNTRSNQPDVAVLKNNLALVWFHAEKDEKENVTFSVRGKLSTDLGKSWGPEKNLSTLGTHPSSPQLFTFEKHFLVVWLEEDADGKTDWKSYVWKP